MIHSIGSQVQHLAQANDDAAMNKFFDDHPSLEEAIQRNVAGEENRKSLKKLNQRMEHILQGRGSLFNGGGSTLLHQQGRAILREMEELYRIEGMLPNLALEELLAHDELGLELLAQLPQGGSTEELPFVLCAKGKGQGQHPALVLKSAFSAKGKGQSCSPKSTNLCETLSEQGGMM